MPRLKYNDQYHTYWIDGQKATGVSGVAKGFQDSYNIDRKVKRDVAKGMARRPDLCTMVAALGDDESWETKKKIDKIATDAVEASGAWAKANHGTAKHTILERVHKGLSLDDVFDDRLVAYAQAYNALIAKSGLLPVAHLTERFVVYPEQLIAGRLDCAYLNDECKFLLGDFKSGSRAVAYPHSIVAQLGLYLNAPFLYNEATDEFDPAPLWGDTIIIAHVPDNLDDFGLWTIDADMARTVALAALERHRYIKSGADSLVKQWIVPSSVGTFVPTDADRRMVSVATATPPDRFIHVEPNDPFDGLTSTLKEDEWLTASSSSTSDITSTGSKHSSSSPKETSPQATSTTSATTSNESATTSTTSTSSTSPTANPERRQWIIERLKVLQQTAGALDRVGILWPDGVPTLKASDTHTDDMYDAIVAVIDLVEAEYMIPFGTPDPTKEKPSPRQSETFSKTPSTESNPVSPMPATSSATSPTPANHSEPPANTSTTCSTSSPDEGPPVDGDTIKALEAAYTRLDDAGRAWIAGIAHDAQTAGRPIHLSHPSLRRFEIVRGLVALAAGGYADDEITRALVRLTLTDEYPVLTAPLATGAVVAGLGPAMAQRFARNCQAFCDGDIAMHIDDNNTITLEALPTRPPAA